MTRAGPAAPRLLVEARPGAGRTTALRRLAELLLTGPHAGVIGPHVRRRGEHAGAARCRGRRELERLAEVRRSVVDAPEA